MKVLKRIQALVLAITMSVMAFGTTTAFAAEVVPDNSMEVGVSSGEENSEVTPRILETIVNQTFTMTSIHTGATRTYNYHNVGAICSFTDMNGNTPSSNTILAIRLYDSNNNLVKEWQGSEGSVLCSTVGINYGGRYYFKYLVASGTQSLKVHMLIVTAPQ